MLMRIVIGIFITLGIVLMSLQIKQIDRHTDYPVWYRHDTLAAAHHAMIVIKNKSGRHPSGSELDQLSNDYNDLWAHLNHLWSTGDVESGKEYYTEDWFTIICGRNPKPCYTGATRTDLRHELTIFNWSSDGLVCTAIDSNILVEYCYHISPDKDSCVRYRETIAVELLFQGDRWRIDGMLHIGHHKELQ